MQKNTDRISKFTPTKYQAAFGQVFHLIGGKPYFDCKLTCFVTVTFKFGEVKLNARKPLLCLFC